MKTKLFSMIFIAVLAITSCKKDAETITVDSSRPSGTFTVTKRGTLVAQNNTPTKGTVELGTDVNGDTFLHLTPDFTTEQGTGTATVYLSKTATFTASPGTGNPDLKLVGVVAKNGEFYFKIAGTVPTTLAYTIIWCGTAGIPFGNANIK